MYEAQSFILMIMILFIFLMYMSIVYFGIERQNLDPSPRLAGVVLWGTSSALLDLACFMQAFVFYIYDEFLVYLTF
jgi:hypothetical protein